jgi:hypothetical protein
VAIVITLFFENYNCENCGHLTGFIDQDRKMLTFNHQGEAMISDREKIEYRYKKQRV